MADTQENASTEEHPSENQQSPSLAPSNKPSRKDKLIVGVIGFVVGVLTGMGAFWLSEAIGRRPLELVALLIPGSLFAVLGVLCYMQSITALYPSSKKILDELQRMTCIFGLLVTDVGLLVFTR